MVRGVVFALGACFIWGLIFVIPPFMTGFTSLEIALGRHLLYGTVSSLIFCKLHFQHKCRYPISIWIKAVYFSLISTIGYYTCVVLSLRHSTPAVCALILGISPVTIAFYGNWKQKETPFKSLIGPSLLIVLGLGIINIPHLQENDSASSYLLGVGFGFLALIAWSWYVVANARFLKHHPKVDASDWATLIGVATLFWVLTFALIFSVFFENQLQVEKYLTPSPELTRFLIGSSILGLLCSWGGASLWNRASLYLPVTLAGQLTIFETIFGVLFFYILAEHMPPTLEVVGIIILLSAVAYGIRQFARKKSYNNQIAP
jgi:drug/metabolite transporter (DMT)-like permease